MAGWLQHRGPVIRRALLVASLTGCFYVEPINQRPAISITAATADAVHRGDVVRYKAVGTDPDGHYILYSWRAYACTDASSPEGCDPSPFEMSIVDDITVVVPTRRMGSLPVESLRIVLEAKDELGAKARPSQELLVPVVNAPPTVVLSKASGYRYTRGTPIDLFATISDRDDGADAVPPPVWEVFAPAQVPYTLTDREVIEDPIDALHNTFAKVFTPSEEGEWMIRVTAVDPIGDATTETLMIAVSSGEAPCLQYLTPIVPTGGAALPVSDPTLFRVPVVIDDLDVYPPQPNDTVRGVARFEWSVKRAADASHALVAGATGNSYGFDPAGYVPGELVEVRVEIFDRNNTPIPCADSDPSCSVVSEPACLQRQTWRVEVR